MFIQNKYTRWYLSIISSAGQRSRRRHDECHHIIPRSLGGSDDPSNLVMLTPKQHYICHALLVHMVDQPKHIRSMYAAFNMMHVGRHGRKYTSNLYQYYKIKFYQYHSKMQMGKIRTLESRQKQSAATKGRPWTEAKKKSAWVGPTAKPVDVFDKKTGEYVGRYDSISAAAKSHHADITTVWKMCEGQHGSAAPNGKSYPIRQHKGLIFQYVNEGNPALPTDRILT